MTSRTSKNASVRKEEILICVLYVSISVQQNEEKTPLRANNTNYCGSATDSQHPLPFPGSRPRYPTSFPSKCLNQISDCDMPTLWTILLAKAPRFAHMPISCDASDVQQSPGDLFRFAFLAEHGAERNE